MVSRPRQRPAILARDLADPKYIEYRGEGGLLMRPRRLRELCGFLAVKPVGWPASNPGVSAANPGDHVTALGGVMCVCVACVHACVSAPSGWNLEGHGGLHEKPHC